MEAKIAGEASREMRQNLAKQLRQMEIIEGLLEFDRFSLELYADAIAEQRQRLTQMLSRIRTEEPTGASNGAKG